MRKTLFSFSVIMIFLLTSGPQVTARETLTIATGEWSPWTGASLKHHGFVGHVVKEAFNRAGYDVTFHFYPWKRAYVMVKNGTVHASAYWYPSEKRKRDCYYSAPLTQEEIVFFHLREHPMGRWETLTDLSGYRIGASMGNTYTDEFWDLAEQGVLSVDIAGNHLLNFKKLLGGRIDIFPAPRNVALRLIKEHFSEETAATIVYEHKPLTVATGHLLFPKARDDSNRLLHLFNENLQRLKTDGTYDLYMERLQQGWYSKQ